MTRKVVILTAGTGSRLNQRTKYFNKALLRVGNKAAISHIIKLWEEKDDMEFVIGLGHLGDTVREYLQLAHPDRSFTFVEIDRYSVPGSGPGYALRKCQEHLQEPFYFVACDTILSDILWYDADCKAKNNNYLIYNDIEAGERSQFCTLSLHKDDVISLHDKEADGTTKAWTGFAHIHSWEKFWAALNDNKKYVQQEIQLAPAFEKLPYLKAFKVPWYDVGSEKGLLKARAAYSKIHNLDKLNEEIYFVFGFVLKYFYDTTIVQRRLQRAEKLSGLVPRIVQVSDHFMKSDYVGGIELFDSEIDIEMPDVLDFAAEKLWTDEFDKDTHDEFIFACRAFYKDKTFHRIRQFYQKTGIVDAEEIINGDVTEKVTAYLARMDWDYLCNKAIPSGFHGDFTPSNIICHKDSFVLIDWRQDFGGLTDKGDRYYDFAKMYASLLAPFDGLRKGEAELKRSSGEIFASIPISPAIHKARRIFEQWLFRNRYSIPRVRKLAALVLLNMSPLHEHPLDQWLYYFGKHLLSKNEHD